MSDSYNDNKIMIGKPMKKESLKKTGTPENHMYDMVNLPKDVVLGVPVVVITGNTEITIENFRGIIEYTEQIIRIKIKCGEIKISGKNLNISYYKNDDVRIVGNIKTIEYYR